MTDYNKFFLRGKLLHITAPLNSNPRYTIQIATRGKNSKGIVSTFPRIFCYGILRSTAKDLKMNSTIRVEGFIKCYHNSNGFQSTILVAEKIGPATRDLYSFHKYLPVEINKYDGAPPKDVNQVFILGTINGHSSIQSNGIISFSIKSHVDEQTTYINCITGLSNSEKIEKASIGDRIACTGSIITQTQYVENRGLFYQEVLCRDIEIF